MTNMSKRMLGGLAATALVAGGVVSTSPLATAAPIGGECTVADTVHVLSFNDFHGRVESAAALFTPVEELRADVGEDHVLLTSNGDSIGGSTFVSAVANDKPTLDVLNAAGLEVSATGNHEYDKGWSDLSGRVDQGSDFPYLAANVTQGGEVPAPLQAYAEFEKAGVTIAVVGAVTGDLPSLVSPAGIEGLEIGDPVEAVNAVAADLKDGDDTNGEADIVIAQIHEGAPNGSGDAAGNASSSPNFAEMYNNLDADNVDVIFNGHTHQSYLWETANGQPIVQAEAYAEELVQVDLGITADGEFCSVSSQHVAPAAEADLSLPRIADINNIVEAAVAEAAEKGAEVIGDATEAISTPGDGGSGTRDQESPMTNMVAQMFYDKMSNGNDEFIGIQNPGGTRTSFDAGDITYEEAALVLPFANSLYTTQLTGAQFKEVLEQQWQRDADGQVPSRPYLALGLSDNVSYTYDENREEGDRITGIYVNGAPIDMDKLYTVGSGSFLISGGDNFHAFADGQNTADAGQVDLTAWVDWIKEQESLSPDYTKRGVSVTEAPTELEAGASGTYTLGTPGSVNPGNLDMFLDASGDLVSPQLANTTVTAYLGDVEIGTGTVADGVTTLDVTIPEGTEPGDYLVKFVIQESGTEVLYPLTVTGAEDDVVEPWIKADPSSFKVGDPVEITGGGFTPGDKVTLDVLDADGNVVMTVDMGIADENGEVGKTVVFDLPPGTYTVHLYDESGNEVEATLTIGGDDDDDDGKGDDPGLPKTGV